LKVLVIGYGSIGKRHTQNLLDLNNDVIVLTKNKQNKSKNKKLTFSNSFKDCLEFKPNAAIICNVTSMHIPIAEKLAKNSVDIFIEKPLSNSTKNLKKLSQVIKRKKIISMVGCNLRFHKCIKKIKEIICKNKLGRIIHVEVESGSYLPDWHPHEDYRESYASHKKFGGGVILTCIHELDYLYWFFGKIEKTISYADKISDLKLDVEDYSGIIAKFQNRVIAEIHLDFFQRPPIRRCKIIGTKGTLLWESTNNQVLLYEIKNKQWKKVFEIKKYVRNEMYVDEIKYFLNCVKKRKIAMNSIEENIQILNTALKIRKSFKNW